MIRRARGCQGGARARRLVRLRARVAEPADAMDSKSISRKGVGVRLPSLALDASRAEGVPELGRELAELLVPHLRCELAAATAALRSLSDPAARASRDERAFARLARVHARAQQAGWCLGLLASEQGADLLGERREARGLRWLVAFVLEALNVPAVSDSPSALDCVALSRGDIVRVAWCIHRAHAALVHPLRARLSETDAGRWLELELATSPCELERELLSRPQPGPGVRVHDGWLGCRLDAS